MQLEPPFFIRYFLYPVLGWLFAILFLQYVFAPFIGAWAGDMLDFYVTSVKDEVQRYIDSIKPW